MQTKRIKPIVHQRSGSFCGIPLTSIFNTESPPDLPLLMLMVSTYPADEITLSAEELSGWIEHRLVGYFPEFISDVTASVESDPA